MSEYEVPSTGSDEAIFRSESTRGTRALTQVCFLMSSATNTHVSHLGHIILFCPGSSNGFFAKELTCHYAFRCSDAIIWTSSGTARNYLSRI